MRLLITQLTRFGLVGSVGLVIDVVIFNILRTTLLAPDVLHEGPIIAKVASTTVAIAANWLGNRHWTFRRDELQHPTTEGIKFILVSIGGIVIGLSCLVISHYVLGFTSLLADNISSNVVGLALGTAFRFWGYRTWVFKAELDAGASPITHDGAPNLGSTERPIGPTGVSPLHRIQAVATVEDRAHSND